MRMMRPGANERDRALRERYGITEDEYEAILAEQGGVCQICRREPTESRRLAVDHCHRTARVRGLLCFSCNSKLGWVERVGLSAVEDYLHRSWEPLTIQEHYARAFPSFPADNWQEDLLELLPTEGEKFLTDDAC